MPIKAGALDIYDALADNLDDMVGSYQEQMAAPPVAWGREQATTVATAATAVRQERAGRRRRDRAPTTTWTEGR
jgi:hypothetical protein